MLQAEVIVPLNQSTGKVILLKVMGKGPKNIIDICSSICALDEMKDLFIDLHGYNEPEDANANWRSLKPKFLYHDSKYNHLTAEIGTFGPSYVNETTINNESVLAANGVEISNKQNLWKYYGCRLPIGEKLFVRYYVDPSNRKKAEEFLGFKLPDDFCKTKFVKNVTDASPDETVQLSL